MQLKAAINYQLTKKGMSKSQCCTTSWRITCHTYGLVSTQSSWLQALYLCGSPGGATALVGADHCYTKV